METRVVDFNPHNYDWQMPESTDWAIEQNQHTPTLLYGRTINYIFNTFMPPTDKPIFHVLEIGSAWGVSTIAILDSYQYIKLDSVDSDPTVKAKAEVEANDLDEQFVFHNMTSDKFFEELELTAPFMKYDAIYVDGSHLYENAKKDLENAWKFTDKEGFIVVDDYCHEKNRLTDSNKQYSEYGVSLALCEFIRDNKVTRIYPVGNLLVIPKGENV